MSDLIKLAERLEQAETGKDTLRFSECVVQGKRGYTLGWVTSTSPAIMRMLCDVWNARKEIAASLREKSA